jgi:hypothetical protein
LFIFVSWTLGPVAGQLVRSFTTSKCKKTNMVGRDPSWMISKPFVVVSMNMMKPNYTPTPYLCFKLMITFASCFTMGKALIEDILKMQGWSQLSPCPRPFILKMPPTMSFTLHIKGEAFEMIDYIMSSIVCSWQLRIISRFSIQASHINYIPLGLHSTWVR